MGRSRPHRGNRRRGRSGGARRRARTLTGTLVISRPGVGCVETPEGTFSKRIFALEKRIYHPTEERR